LNPWKAYRQSFALPLKVTVIVPVVPATAIAASPMLVIGTPERSVLGLFEPTIDQLSPATSVIVLTVATVHDTIIVRRSPVAQVWVETVKLDTLVTRA